MAKGLRSKVKRAFRTVRRATVAETPEAQKAEVKRQQLMDEIVARGKAAQAARDAERAQEEAAAPKGMDDDAAAAAAAGGAGAGGAAAGDQMDTDARLKPMKKLGKGKRMKKVTIGLSGANQFHRKAKKGKKRNKKNNPGYTIATSY